MINICNNISDSFSRSSMYKLYLRFRYGIAIQFVNKNQELYHLGYNIKFEIYYATRVTLNEQPSVL